MVKKRSSCSLYATICNFFALQFFIAICHLGNVCVHKQLSYSDFTQKPRRLTADSQQKCNLTMLLIKILRFFGYCYRHINHLTGWQVYCLLCAVQRCIRLTTSIMCAYVCKYKKEMQ